MSRLFATLSVLVLAACGGQSIELKLMDAPPDGVSAVKLYVASMDVHVVDKDKAKDADPLDATIDSDDKWSSLEVNKEIDLVQHQGEDAAAVLGQLDLPVGKITQIRLHLDTTKPNVATFNGADCNLDLSKVDPKGIKISHPFKAIDADGGKVEAWVDVELDKVLKPTKDCFQLEPVIKLHKVKVDDQDVAL